MKRFIGLTLVLVMGMLFSNAASASDFTPTDVRRHTDQLCDQNRLAEATNLAMKHLLDARARHGNSSQIASDYMMVVAEVSRRRGKFYLAQKLYDRALGIQASTVTAGKAVAAPILEQDRIVWLKNQLRALSDSGDSSAAVAVSMGELLRARSAYGASHPYTAQYTAIVGDVARVRGKFHLASVMYQKAFAVLQEEIGTTDSKKTAQKLTEPSSF